MRRHKEGALNSSAMMTVKIARTPPGRRIFGRVKGLRGDDTVEDLECEVPHGEDDNDGDQPREDQVMICSISRRT